MNKAKLSRKRLLRRLFEDGAPAATAVPNNNNNQENISNNLNNTTTNGEADLNKVPFTVDDVAKMTNGEVINYLYVAPPENIDAATKNALLKRADEIRKNAESDANIKDRAKEIMRTVGLSLEL